MEGVILTTCSSPIDANLIKSKLASEGIEAYLINENFTRLMPIYYNILGSGIRIMVHKEDLERARLITNIQPNKVLCPNCGSDQVELAFKSKRNKLFVLFLSIFAALPFGNLLNEFVCNKCSCEFSR